MWISRKLRLHFITLLMLPVFASTVSADDSEPHHAASHAVGFSGGWISGNGVTYRRYFGDHFVQGTFFGIVSNSANDAYLNTAVSAGTYLHRIEAAGIVPPMGLKMMAGADLVLDRRKEENGTSSGGGSTTTQTGNFDMSYYGGGVGLDIGNPGRAGLSLWFAVNYVFAYDGITSPAFDWFGVRPAGGILYSW